MEGNPVQQGRQDLQDEQDIFSCPDGREKLHPLRVN
jgi:hypothetical protein